MADIGGVVGTQPWAWATAQTIPPYRSTGWSQAAWSPRLARATSSDVAAAAASPDAEPRRKLCNQPLPNARMLRARGASCDHELADDHMGRAIASATALGAELQLRRPDVSREAAQPEPLRGAFSKEGRTPTGVSRP